VTSLLEHPSSKVNKNTLPAVFYSRPRQQPHRRMSEQPENEQKGDKHYKKGSHRSTHNVTLGFVHK
jgi:hypothetical protein